MRKSTTHRIALSPPPHNPLESIKKWSPCLNAATHPRIVNRVPPPSKALQDDQHHPEKKSHGMMSLAISKYIPRIQCIPRPNNSCTKPASSPSSSPSPSSSVSEQYLHSTQQPLLPSYLPPFSSLVLQEQEKHSSPRPSPTSPKGPFSNSILQTVCPSGWERVNR